MEKGTTSTGFNYEYDKAVADDMEFVELLLDVEENEHHLPKLIDALLGKAQKKKLYEHCRNEDGRVPATRVYAEFNEILNGSPETKNS